jgi:hypothetical protein
MQRPDLELPIIRFYMAKDKNLLIISDRNFFSSQSLTIDMDSSVKRTDHQKALNTIDTITMIYT